MANFYQWRGKLPHVRLPGSAYLLTSRLRKSRPELDTVERTVVLRACLHWNGHGWQMYAAVVMPDHFHLVGFVDISKANKPITIANLAKSIKGYSAREINKLRSIKGSLWQREYHDRILPNKRALLGAIEYLLGNPVKAGLAEEPEDYPWLWTEWAGSSVLG